MEEDIKRIKACCKCNDYFSALNYVELVIDKYTNKEKEFLLSIKTNIKSGNYEEVNKILYI